MKRNLANYLTCLKNFEDYEDRITNCEDTSDMEYLQAEKKYWSEQLDRQIDYMSIWSGKC